jgi:LTXXQ motif family protein
MGYQQRGFTMKFPPKSLIIATSLIALTAVTAGFLSPSGARAVAGALRNEVFRVKDLSRVVQVVGGNYRGDKSVAIELAQADGPSSFPPTMSFPHGVPFPLGPGPMMTFPRGVPLPLGPGSLFFDGPMRPHGPMRADGTMEPPRRECLENIHRHSALAGYLKSKLRLQENQKEAWRKIEEAAGPTLEAMQALCDQLPDPLGAPPTIPDMIDFAEKQNSARAAFLRAIRAPFRALYDSLTAEQRALLQLLPPDRL